jgi:hypothetical protein
MARRSKRLSAAIDFPSSTALPPAKRSKLHSTIADIPSTSAAFVLRKHFENPSAVANPTNQNVTLSGINPFGSRSTAGTSGTSVVPFATSLFFKLPAELRYTVYDYLLPYDDQPSTLNFRHLCRGAMEDLHKLVLSYVDILIAAANKSSAISLFGLPISIKRSPKAADVHGMNRVRIDVAIDNQTLKSLLGKEHPCQ